MTSIRIRMDAAELSRGDRSEPAGRALDPAIVARVREEYRYIVVEGVIGAGKTTLAEQLSEQLRARLVLERFEENPFLDRFYEDPARWAFQTQLSFLAARFQQQNRLVERDLFHDVVVSDYAFEKDRIFASVNLEGDELLLYETLYRTMERTIPVPDLILYLQATPERLLRNIRIRGRSFEQNISRAYLERLSEAYDYYFLRYTKTPLLIVNMEEVDFVEDPWSVDELLRQIGTTTYRGTTFFRTSQAASSGDQ